MNIVLSVTHASRLYSLSLKESIWWGCISNALARTLVVYVANAKFVESYIIFCRSTISTEDCQNFERDRRVKPSSEGRN